MVVLVVVMVVAVVVAVGGTAVLSVGVVVALVVVAGGRHLRETAKYDCGPTIDYCSWGLEVVPTPSSSRLSFYVYMCAYISMSLSLPLFVIGHQEHAQGEKHGQ